MYLWPFRLLPPGNVRWTRQGTAHLGPMSIDGATQQASRTDGGGLWRCDATFEARSRDQVLALRAWAVHLDGGTTEFLMPVLDLPYAPRSVVAGKLHRPGKPPKATDPFTEAGNYGPTMMVAEAVGAAALRATSIVIDMQQGGKIQAGQIFSVEHGAAGWRKYNISRVTAQGGDLFTVTFRPPLRQAVASGAGIEFDMPRCVMRLHPDSANDLDQAIDLLKVGGTVSTSFIESFAG